MTEPPPLVPLMPRLGHGFVWSDLVAEIERDDEKRRARPARPVHSWKPAPVIRVTPAGDNVHIQPAADPSGVPWFLRWVC